VRRRRIWILHRLMAERVSAAELRSYGLRRFLLDQYDRVMAAGTTVQLDLARRMTTTLSIGSVVGGVSTAAVYVLLGLLLLGGNIPLSAAATCVIALQAAQRSLATVNSQIDEIYIEGQHLGDFTGSWLEQPSTCPPPPAALSPVRFSRWACTECRCPTRTGTRQPSTRSALPSMLDRRSPSWARTAQARQRSPQ
jgi:ATP-binding cassette, subfamily B, bacterial